MVLSSEYEIPMNTAYGEEIELMCNLSGRIEEKGLEQGKAMEFISTIEKLKESLSVPLEEALRILGKTMQDYVNAQKLLK